MHAPMLTFPPQAQAAETRNPRALPAQCVDTNFAGNYAAGLQSSREQTRIHHCEYSQGAWSVLVPQPHVQTTVCVATDARPQAPASGVASAEPLGAANGTVVASSIGGAAAPSVSVNSGGNSGGGGIGGGGGDDDEMKRAAAALVAELTASGDPKAILEAMAALPQVLLLFKHRPLRACQLSGSTLSCCAGSQLQ